MEHLLQKIQQGERPTLVEFVDSWGERFPLLYDLKNTPQDPEWHQEGDVFRHTEMVLEETYLLLEREAGHLSSENKLALILAAVFHDIAKPLTTRQEEKKGKLRIVSPRHAERGRDYLAYKILGGGLAYSVVDKVLTLVRYHHNPKFLVIRDQPLAKWRQLARLVDMELVYYLERADIQGREATDKPQQLENIELFRMFATEYGLFGNPDPYLAWRDTIVREMPQKGQALWDMVVATAIREAEAGKIYSPEEALGRCYSLRQGFGHLILTCGPSGAGKSSWVAEQAKEYPVICLDELREEIAGKRSDQDKNGEVMQKAQEMLKQHLRNKQTVVMDATSLRKDFRRRFLKIARNYQAYTTLVVFHIPEQELWRRNGVRVHPVPEKVLQRQLERCQLPDLDEADAMLVIGEGGQTVLSASGGITLRLME